MDVSKRASVHFNLNKNNQGKTPRDSDDTEVTNIRNYFNEEPISVNNTSNSRKSFVRPNCKFMEKDVNKSGSGSGLQLLSHNSENIAQAGGSERKSIWKIKKKSFLKQNSKDQNGANEVLNSTIKQIIGILKHDVKSKEDILFLYNFFENGKSAFLKVLKDQTLHYEDLLMNLCSEMRYQHYQSNSVMFKYGDTGEMFYIILSGSISIIIPSQSYVNMTEEEYLNYLVGMKIRNETECFEQALYNRNNKGVLPLDNDNLDQYLIDNYNSSENTFKIRDKVFVKSKMLLRNIKSLVDFINTKHNSVFYAQNAIDEKASSPSKLITAIQENREEPVSMENIKSIFQSIFSQEKEKPEEPADPNSPLKKSGTERSSFLKKLNKYFNKSKRTIEDTSKEMYLNERRIDRYQQDNAETDANYNIHKVQVVEYIYLKDLYDGEKFGDGALDKINKKRTATIITSSETHLISIQKNVYDSFLKDAVDKGKKSNINFLLSSKLFDNYNKQYFQNKFLNFFDFRKCRMGDLIARQDEKFEYIIFIKEGTFEMTCERSLNDLNKLIEILSKPKIEESFDRNKIAQLLDQEQFKNISNGINLNLLEANDQKQLRGGYESTSSVSKVNEQYYLKYIVNNRNYKKLIKDKVLDSLDAIHFDKSLTEYFKKKQTIRLEILLNNNFFGIEELILKCNWLFNIKCISNSGDYCILSKESYLTKFYGKQSHQDNLFLSYFKRKSVLENIIVNIKDNKISSFCDKYLKEGIKSIFDTTLRTKTTLTEGRINVGAKISKKDTYMAIFIANKKNYDNASLNLFNQPQVKLDDKAETSRKSKPKSAAKHRVNKHYSNLPNLSIVEGQYICIPESKVNSVTYTQRIHSATTTDSNLAQFNSHSKRDSKLYRPISSNIFKSKAQSSIINKFQDKHDTSARTKNPTTQSSHKISDIMNGQIHKSNTIGNIKEELHDQNFGKLETSDIEEFNKVALHSKSSKTRVQTSRAVYGKISFSTQTNNNTIATNTYSNMDQSLNNFPYYNCLTLEPNPKTAKAYPKIVDFDLILQKENAMNKRILSNLYETNSKTLMAKQKVEKNNIISLKKNKGQKNSEAIQFETPKINYVSLKL